MAFGWEVASPMVPEQRFAAVASEYRVNTTSSSSMQVEDIPLASEEDLDRALTRRILRVQLVKNLRDANSPVKLCIMHQRRASKQSPWTDAASFDLRHLRAGEDIKLDLNCDETLRLFHKLRDLYAMTEDGLPLDRRQVMVVDPNETLIMSGPEQAIIRRLVQQEGDQFWQVVDGLSPGLVETVAQAKVHQRRRAAVECFERELAARAWSEGEWDRFFRENIWIFGYGLDYQFLSQVQQQAYLGGANLAGTGGQRLDFLMATRAAASFTVLVDIKKPNSALVGDKYRNKVYLLGEELVGGVAQLQSYCRRWLVEGSRQEENAAALHEAGVATYEPRGILVVGHSAQLDNANKQASFESFRRNLHNPTVLTYDELLERARFVVSVEEEKQASQADR